MTAPPGGGPAGANPEAERVFAALEALVGDDDRWVAVDSPGFISRTRVWPDGTADTLVILSPETGYAGARTRKDGKSGHAGAPGCRFLTNWASCPIRTHRTRRGTR